MGRGVDFISLFQTENSRGYSEFPLSGREQSIYLKEVLLFRNLIAFL